MNCYVIIELNSFHGKVSGVWTYMRPEDAYVQYRKLLSEGALPMNLMIVKTTIGRLVPHYPAEFQTEAALEQSVKDSPKRG